MNNKGDDTHRKNIIVIDEQGRVYEATYPKRAKGLVKNGRARFVNENTICLACPPKNSEDYKMNEKMKKQKTSSRMAAQCLRSIMCSSRLS